MEPYEAGLIKGRSPSIKESVSGHLVVVLDSRRENRQLKLIYPQSRCVRAGDVHELIVTDEVEAEPGREVNRVAGVGFMLFERSGVLMVGDDLRCKRAGFLGTVAGFDLTHYPNHFNIILFSDNRRSGREHGLKLGDELLFEGQDEWQINPDD